MLWLLNVGLMRRIVEHCKITGEHFWLFCTMIEVAVFPLLLTFLMFLVADRHDEEHFFSFFCLVVGMVFMFSIYFSLLLFSRWLIGKTCSYFLFQRLAEGSSWLASSRQSAFSYIFLLFSFLFAFLFPFKKMFCIKTMRFRRIYWCWYYDKSF